MLYPVPARWNPARPGRSVGRVEVWSGAEQVASVDTSDVLSCKVTEKYATGVRWSLSMTVEPTAQWLRWAQLPGLEIRPYAGFSWGRSEFLCPMGRYPTLPPAVSLPASSIQFTANDRWSWVQNNTFANPRPSYSSYTVRDAVALLLAESAASTVYPVVTASREDMMPDILWDRGAHDAILQAVESIGAEAFIDRDGVPIVRDVTTVTGAPLVDGDDGTVVSISSTVDWSNVRNAIEVTSSNDQVKFDPVRLMIEDRNHPAVRYVIGVKSFGYSSPLFMTREQAIHAAPVLLDKKASPARSWSVSCLADPSRSAGDTVPVSTDLGDFTAVIQEASHDLGGADLQLTLGAA